MKTIRDYAKEVGFEIVGKLTRTPEAEMSDKHRAYVDQAGNEYYKSGNSICITTADGAVI